MQATIYVTGQSGLRPDRERGTIPGVKVLGWRSKNGREYKPDGISPSLYEGKPVNLNHRQGRESRDVRDRFGWLEHVERRPDGIYAALRILNPKTEFAQGVMTAAQLKPDLFGLSHEADGNDRRGSNGTVIESVVVVECVALVDGPASVNGLNEAILLAESISRSPSIRTLRESFLREITDGGVSSRPRTSASGTGNDQAPPDRKTYLAEIVH